jgi:hypothetical protein
MSRFRGTVAVLKRAVFCALSGTVGCFTTLATVLLDRSLLLCFLCGAGNGWLLSFASRVRHFRTASTDRIVLRYAPELSEVADVPGVLSLAEKTWLELEAKFGARSRSWLRPLVGPLLFRRRTCVYLFATCQPIQEMFGKHYAAVALTGLHGVVVALEARLDEHLKHELAHLFATRWSRWAPPLFAEGLPTWLQGTHGGYTIDAMAVLVLREGNHQHLRPLLDEEFFFDEANRFACYVLAGSFSGFLIRRFGWEAYKRLYCELWGDFAFDAKFRKHFGLSLKEAKEQWRDELLRRYQAPLKEWFVLS